MAFFELLFVGIHGVSDLSGVPINEIEFGHLFGFMMFFEFFLVFEFGEFIKLDNMFEELLIIKFVAEGLEMRESGVDSEDDWEFEFHGGPEYFELLFREVELELIELSEDLIIFGNGFGAPLLMDFFMAVFVFVVAAG